MKPIIKKTERMLSLEKRFGVPIEELLRSLYVDENMSLADMQDLLGTQSTLILRWLPKAGIYSRKLDI